MAEPAMPPMDGMTIPTADNLPETTSPSGSATNDSWRELKRDDAIQFEPVEIPELPPYEPGWLDAVFEFLASLFGPLGRLLGSSWPVLKWVLLALALALVLVMIVRIAQAQTGRFGPRRSGPDTAAEWVPTQEESATLLGDADQLAAEGKFDEATHLLLLRSINQIAASRPDWVAPSSTSRELIALPFLSTPARTAFQSIAERVERSMFALRALNQSDWEAARSAYTDFAMANIEQEQPV